MFDWIQFEPLRSISSDGPLRGPLGLMGALWATSGPSDDDVTWPMSLPVERCSIGFNLNPFGPSVPTGPFGALWAPWGPSCDDVTWPIALPVERCSIGFNLNPFGTSVPTGPFGALWAPWGPCGPLRGPLMTMLRGLCHSRLNFVQLDSI